MCGVGVRTYSTGRVVAGRWRANQLEAPLDLWQCAPAAEGAAEAALAARRVPVGGGAPADAAALLAAQPALWAAAAGLALAAAGTGLPQGLAGVAAALAPANRPLMLLSAGMLLRFRAPAPRQVREGAAPTEPRRAAHRCPARSLGVHPSPAAPKASSPTITPPLPRRPPWPAPRPGRRRLLHPLDPPRLRPLRRRQRAGGRRRRAAGRAAGCAAWPARRAARAARARAARRGRVRPGLPPQRAPGGGGGGCLGRALHPAHRRRRARGVGGGAAAGRRRRARAGRGRCAGARRVAVHPQAHTRRRRGLRPPPPPRLTAPSPLAPAAPAPS
jgi:hypothetical protein